MASTTFQRIFLGATVVERRITLTDIDRPGEALEVDIVAADETSLTLAVPNTSVQFKLFRHSRKASYTGSLGGRSFFCSPDVVDSTMTAALTIRVHANGPAAPPRKKSGAQ
ncbi:hypothetical protein [Methylosinus sp. Sm6]|uniref:hypothetical protein n=1 Tax=Methylosinus sp. Sm6 TaxID=2866948 RepID=UPI001C99D2F0|nr:hypothetical protein [Methylosinus sp. Sm6]MBY6243692.1 hypothetical protein [Methylosinus sp. Sm6]